MRLGPSALPVLLAFAALPLAACDAKVPPPAPSAAPVATAPAPGPNRRALEAALRPWLTRRDATPKKLFEQKCPDDAIRAATSDDDERVLALRVEDARWEKKSLLPLRVTRELTAPEPPSLETALMTRNGPVDPGVASQVEWLARRRYVGVFHVLDFSAPRVIHRLGHLRPEWVAGWVRAWLVVHDAKSGEALCATQMLVKNDVENARLEKRRRSDETDRLMGELGTTLRHAVPEALGKISAELRIDAPRVALAP